MELYPIDDDRRLFMSGDLQNWESIGRQGIDVIIDVIIDLDGGLDACIPTDANRCLYVYFPFADDDQDLPSVAKLQAVAAMGATLMRHGHRVLAHCNMGFNRSGLVAGAILKALGMSGEAAVTRIRDRRPGALYNERFTDYLLSD